MESGSTKKRSGAGALREVLRWVGFVAAFLALAELARLLAFEIRNTGFVVFWPPAGLLLAVLVRVSFAHWWRAAVALLVGNLIFDCVLHGSSVQSALVFWFGNFVGTALGAVFLKNCRSCSFSMEKVRDVWYLLIGGGLITPAGTSLVTTFLLAHGSAESTWPSVLTTFLGSGLGVLLFAPPILAWTASDEGKTVVDARITYPRLLEGISGGALSLVVADAVFDHAGDALLDSARYPFWLFLSVVWAGLRFPPRYAYILIWGVMFLAISETAAGRGLFAAPHQPIENRILLVQGFVCVMALVTISLAASVTQRRAAEADLLESRRALQSFFDEANDLIMWIRPDGQLLSANRAWRNKLGFSENAIPSLTLRDVVDPESWDEHQNALGSVAEGAEATATEMVLRGCDGRRILVETSVSAYRVGGKLDHYRQVCHDITHQREHEQEREKLIGQLQTALTEVKTLRGFIPICSGCKKIRTEAGAWQELQDYLRPRMEGVFTHGLCSDCGREQFGAFWEEVENEKRSREPEGK